MIFDGSDEADGSFLIYAGQGTDTIKGGKKSDGFFFDQGFLTVDDRIDGGENATGTGDDDQIGLRGNYNLVLGEFTIKNIETIALLSGKDTRFGPLGPDYSYQITTHEQNVASGETLTVNAGTLRATESVIFDGQAEQDGGSFRFFGGAGGDQFTGGAGADWAAGGLGQDSLTGGPGKDAFVYRTTADSDATNGIDSILDFAAGDRIDLSMIDANGEGAGNGAFTFIETAAFGHVPGQLRVENKGGYWQLEGDTDGDGDADLVILLVLADADPITAGDFML